MTATGIFLTADEVSGALERGFASGRDRMVELCESFPVLRNAPGANPWQPERFAKWASSGARTSASSHAAAFVLSVWNGGTPPDGGWWNEKPFAVGVFDVVDAFGRWDGGQKAAFLAWCSDPFWP